MHKRLLSAALFGLGFAEVAHAQSVLTPGATGETFAQVVDHIVVFVDVYLIPLLYSLAFLLFLVGLLRFFFTGGEENRKKGKTFLLWGLIAFVVLFGLWGMVNLLLSILPK